MRASAREILDRYQVRKTKKQKTAFICYMKGLLSGMGYKMRVEGGAAGSRNIVVGDISKAKVVMTAHYDTAPILPFPNFITPRSIGIYVLYQAVLTLFFLAIYAAVEAVASYLFVTLPLEFLEEVSAEGFIVRFVKTVVPIVLILVGAVLLMQLMLKGPANKHTANDNTSGVATLIAIMEDLPEHLRDKVAFVFFDNEEVGLVGSRSFSQSYRSSMKNKLLLNFDCVSDGEDVLFVLPKRAAEYENVIARSFVSTERYNVIIAKKHVIYPSDQVCFPLGVDVAALKRTKRGLLYMNRIHTSRDIIFNEENIEFIKDGALALIEGVS